MPDWTFLTNHGHVLLYIAAKPDVRISELSDAVGIGERAAQRIVADLVAADYVRRERVGRRNRYSLNADRHLRHPIEHEHQVGRMVGALAPGPGVIGAGAAAAGKPSGSTRSS